MTEITRMTETADLPNVMTVQDVAQYCEVSPKTIYDALKRGDLQSARVGRLIRIHRDDVMSFLRGNARVSRASRR